MSFSIPSRFIRKGPCGSGGAWTAAAGSGGAGGAWSTGTGVAGGPVPLGPGDASIDGEATGTGVGVGTNTGVGTGAGLGAGLGDGRGSATGESTKQEPRSSVRCTANYKRPHDRANSRDIPTTRGHSPALYSSHTDAGAALAARGEPTRGTRYATAAAS